MDKAFCCPYCLLLKKTFFALEDLKFYFTKVKFTFNINYLSSINIAYNQIPLIALEMVQ